MIPLLAELTETQVAAQVYRRRVEDETPAESGKLPGFRWFVATPVLAELPQPAWVGDGTPIESELNPEDSAGSRAVNPLGVGRLADGSSVEDAGAQGTELEVTSRQRYVLLAQKYASRGASREQLARLELLSGRLRVLLPPVTPEELAQLESMAVASENARARFAGIRERHGIA